MIAELGGYAMLETPPPEAYARPPAELDPWLVRRSLGWGASELPALLVALGRRPLAWLPPYLHPDARITNRTRGQPRVVAQKAGLVPGRKRGAAADRGSRREQELLACWASSDEADVLCVPGSVTHASSVPREWLPLVDRRCPVLSCTPDGWARERAFGALVALECKCSVVPYRALRADHAVQVQAQIAVMDADYGVIVEGPAWAGDDRNATPPRTWGPIERDDEAIAELREAAVEGWARVLDLRTKHEGDER